MNVFKRLGRWFKKLFKKVDEVADKVLPIAIKVVEGIKKVIDSPVDDVLTTIIPGDIDDKAVELLEEWLPKLLLGLQVAQDIADIEDTNEQLKAVLERLKLAPDDTKKIIWHGLAALIAEKLADGKLTWAEIVEIVEDYYAKLKE